ncbi:MAG: Bax inhibitor-1/YccA family protein [Clostridiales bacterium]|uniref:Bax inhibitor-1/YccA family protein n=1 Tax=Clostridium sp. N3C TaxID=1776758 RepID=UPI00092E0E9D|nr:Bax inhibitor-1/YccA family protein [Clostridium sp. N3C]NLZ48985.1 Bax inhibitor-1/YccA family protein [Clostridiales bacterium]SCN23258.1 Inner membrane protein YbhL [Clostridium sp. N3C]
MENLYVKSESNFISKTLLIMALGLLVTFATAVGTQLLITSNENYLIKILPFIFVAMILEVVVVWNLSRRIDRLSISAARTWFFVYSFLNGFTLSIVFYAYGLGTVSVAFGLCALMFFCSAMIGITTKKDLSTLGRVLIMGVIGLILIEIIGIILPSAFLGMNKFISLLGIAIFCGLTAYDMQKIKHFHQSAYAYDESYRSKFAVIAALSLYLDFINIFLYVIKLLKSKD